MVDAKVICFHFGKFNFELEDILATKIKDELIESDVEKAIVRKIKSSFVESIQNIRTHSKIGTSQKLEGHSYGVISVIEKEEEITILSGNVIDPKDEDVIASKIDAINAMDENELKEAYMGQQREGQISEKGGAGLGLMTMARNSDQDILYYFDDTEDGNKMFLMEVSFKCEPQV